MNPIDLFTNWFNEEMKLSKLSVPTAVCLSTIGTDNFPNARFISFKEIVDNCFIITGTFNSRKGIEIERNNKVALTFWWTETERQVRIQGTATKIANLLADKYFSDRDLSSQIISSISEQGKPIENLKLLEDRILEASLTNTKIQKPENWGGYSIDPIRIEFMEFKKSRFHNRKCFELENEKWTTKQIQP